MEHKLEFVEIKGELAGGFFPLCHGNSLLEALQARKQGVAIGAMDQEEKPVAAVVGRMEKETLVLTSLWVKPELRNYGLGTQLLRSALAYAFRSGCQGAMCSYPMPECSQLEDFLFERGFEIDDEAVQTYHCDTKALRKGLVNSAAPVMRGRLMPLGDLPPALRNMPGKSSGKPVTILSQAGQYPGKPLPEACLACVRDNRVVGYTICRRSPDGVLATLNQIYLAPGAADVGLPLLNATLAFICRSGAEEFAFSAITDDEQQLMEGLGKLLGVSWELRCHHGATYVRRRVELQDAEPENMVLEYLIPRLNGLQYLLGSEEHPVESRLMFEEDALPHLEAEWGGRTIQLRFVPLEDEKTFEDPDRYLLMGVTWLHLPNSLSPQEAQDRCLLYNGYASLGPLATYNVGEHTIQLRYTMPETGGLAEASDYRLFLDLLRSGADYLLPEEKEES